MSEEPVAPRKAATIYKEQLASVLMTIATGVGVLAILGTFFSRLSVNTEIMSHFYAEYFLILLMLTPPLFFLKKRIAAAFLTACLLICCARLLPLYLPVNREVPANAPHFSVVQLNIDFANKNLKPAISYINNSGADLVCMEEVTEAMVPQLVDGLKEKYPYHCAVARRDSFGVAMFSKRACPMAAHYFGKVPLPCVVAKAEIGGKPVTVIAAHTIPPYEAKPLSARNAEMMGIANDRQLLGDRYLVCGDLNCTMWSPYFQDMLNAGHFKDSMMGFGVQPSWPAELVELRIPIDQVLTSKQFITVRRNIGPAVGSDHFPLFAELAMAE